MMLHRLLLPGGNLLTELAYRAVLRIFLLTVACLSYRSTANISVI
jgi:hypothetical protein